MSGQGSEPFTDGQAEETGTEASYRRTFLVMCLCFGLNHAAVTTPVGYASGQLGTQVGSASNTSLYGMCLVSSLFLGPLTTSFFGPKKALVFGMIMYVIYVFCFAIATAFADPFCDDGTESGFPMPDSGCAKDLGYSKFIKAKPLAWVFAVIGALIGGVGAGSLWTAQGAFFNAIAENIANASGQPLQAITAQMSSSFAMWYLGQECFWKVFFSILTSPDYIGAGFLPGFMLYAALAGVATVVLFFGKDARPAVEASRGPVCARAAAAINLWSDPKIWLLSGSNITFGFSVAYVNGYINGNSSGWLTAAIPNGGFFVGFLGAIIAAVATVSSWLYGLAAESMGTKLPVVVFGACCFLAIALLSLITAPDGEGPGGWGWGIVVFYLLQGLGRGVYESTNKGIFADFFPGEKGVGAFANCMMQNTASATVGYALGLGEVDQYAVYILIPSALLTVPMLMVATRMKSSTA